MPSNYLREPEFESLESDILSAVRESLKGLSDPRLLEVDGTSDVSRNHVTGLEYVHGEGFVLQLADEEGSYLVTLRRLYR